MKLCSAGCMDNNRHMKLYSPGCMKITEKWSSITLCVCTKTEK
jgi:hypothetical protein